MSEKRRENKTSENIANYGMVFHKEEGEPCLKE